MVSSAVIMPTSCTEGAVGRPRGSGIRQSQYLPALHYEDAATVLLKELVKTDNGQPAVFKFVHACIGKAGVWRHPVDIADGCRRDITQCAFH